MSASFSHKHFVKQRDAMHCGIACIAMICKYLGNPIPVSIITSVCSMTSAGVPLKGIADTAERLGIKTQSARVSIAQLQQCPLPCLLHWNQNHYVLLYKVKKGKYYIADPAVGLLNYSVDEFLLHWASNSSEEKDPGIGIAMFFEPTTTFFDTIYTANHNKGEAFRFLLKYIILYRKYFTYIAIGLLLGCLLQLIMPFLTQMVVDVGISHKDIGLIWLILLGELMIVIGRTATNFIRSWISLHISMRINIFIKSDFFIKLLKLPMPFFEAKQMGDLMQRMDDHNRIQSFLTSQSLSISFSVFSLIVFSIVLLVYDSLIFGVFVLGSIIYGLWLTSFLHRRKTLDYALFERQAANQNRTYQFLTSIQEIKLQNCENRRRWEWEDIQADLFTIQLKSLKLQQTQEAGSLFINELKNIIITVLSATAVINGSMTLGAMLAIQYIIGQLSNPVDQLMRSIYSVQDVKISLERINDVHNAHNEDNESNNLSHFNQPSDKSISVRNIVFKYDIYSSHNTIDNISFEIPQGKVTAIVGASGSGKSTLIKLLLGYYPLLRGDVLVSGYNLKEYNLKWWRQQCGVVMQDGVIFSESIARNIAVDDSEIDYDRLDQAAKISCIYDFIHSLPLRYNTNIGRDGMGLSQGQRQRILIARAVYKNPDFIFLDEATNSLDAKNELEIVNNLNEFYKGRTVIIVAHRLSTVKNADQIIVLGDGAIKEVGNHSTLIARKGSYYNLVKNQLELGV